MFKQLWLFDLVKLLSWESIFWGGRRQVQSEFRERASHIWKKAFRNSYWLPATHILTKENVCADALSSWGKSLPSLRKFIFLISCLWGGVGRTTDSVYCFWRGFHDSPHHLCVVSLAIIGAGTHGTLAVLMETSIPSVVHWHSLPFYYVFRNTYCFRRCIWRDQGYIRSYVHLTYKMY